MTEIGANRQNDEAAAKPGSKAGAHPHEGRFHEIFDGARVALWDEDFSSVLALLDGLRVAGITDIRAHFERHPAQLREALESIRLLDVNRYALELFEADSKDVLLASVDQVIVPETQSVFIDQLVALADGK